MKALVALILSRHLWGHIPRSTRNYRVGNQTHSGEEHYDSDGRQFDYQQGLFSTASGFIVGPTQSIQQTQRYLSPGAKRSAFKLNTHIPHLPAHSGAYAQIQLYLLRLTLGLGAARPMW